MYYPSRISFPANISKLVPLSIKQTWVHYPNLGSPTSHGHNSLTLRSYVAFTYHRKWHEIYYPYIIVLPSNILKLILLYIKQTWVHYPNLFATEICYRNFSKGCHQSIRVEINLQWLKSMRTNNPYQMSINLIQISDKRLLQLHNMI
jgi:hypothetical protein